MIIHIGHGVCYRSPELEKAGWKAVGDPIERSRVGRMVSLGQARWIEAETLKCVDKITMKEFSLREEWWEKNPRAVRVVPSSVDF